MEYHNNVFHQMLKILVEVFQVDGLLSLSSILALDDDNGRPVGPIAAAAA